jgi:hypothetical protein
MIVAAVFCATLVGARDAAAATARVHWLPTAPSGVSGYAVYVRNAGSPYGSPQWTGNPTAAADGTLSALVPYNAAASGVNYFTVVAFGGSLESGLSQELPVGDPDPCHLDSCWAKTSCNFATLPDGTPCDDSSFCNGAEQCHAGACAASAPRSCADNIACTVDSCDEAADRCTHTGPPGCCVACDSSDPCLIDACNAGDCTAPGGIELAVDRVRLQNKAAGIMLAAKASFAAEGPIDPDLTGATVELRTPDGALLYTATIEAERIKRGADANRFRFAAPKLRSASSSENGVTRLDFRLKRDVWHVTLKAETPLLFDAFLEPTTTWVVRLGNTCARRQEVICDQSELRSVCR